jgi:CheY-specific phosphatase CheX
MYLADHANINVTAVHTSTDDIAHLRLRPSTAVIGIGGSTGLHVAFSFPRELVDVLFERLTAEITLPPGEDEHYRRATVAEVANIIVGNCTADLTLPGQCIAITPPILLHDTKDVFRTKDASFGVISMVTPHGSFDIHVVAPKESYDSQLNCAKEN